MYFASVNVPKRSQPSLAVSPVENLPAELISYIFEIRLLSNKTKGGGSLVGWRQAPPREGEFGRRGIFSERKKVPLIRARQAKRNISAKVLPFQVLVSHVCRRWRGVALSTPLLWTELTFLDTAPGFFKTQAFILRSKDLPLDIHINAMLPRESIGGYNPRVRVNLQMALDLIIPCVSRWRSFNLSTTGCEHMEDTVNRLAIVPCAPVLEVFRLYQCNHFRTDWLHVSMPAGIVPFNGDTPRLRELALGGIHFDWVAARGMLRGLRCIQFLGHEREEQQPFNEFCEMVEHSPDLHTLILYDSGPKLRRNQAMPSINLPSLKVLGLYNLVDEYMVLLMRTLMLPNIRNLTLDCGNMDDERVNNELAEVLANQSILERLEFLKLWGMPWEKDGLKTVFERLTNIKSLIVFCDPPDFSEEYLCLLKSGVGLYDDEFVESDNESISSKEYNSEQSKDNKRGGSGGTDNEVEEDNGNGNAEVEEEDENVTFRIRPSSFKNSPIVPKLFCPLLENLGTTTLGGAELRRIVELRAEQGCPLRSMVMSCYGQLPAVETKWLKDRLASFKTFRPEEEEDWRFIEFLDDESSESEGE